MFVLQMWILLQLGGVKQLLFGVVFAVVPSYSIFPLRDHESHRMLPYLNSHWMPAVFSAATPPTVPAFCMRSHSELKSPEAVFPVPDAPWPTQPY